MLIVPADPARVETELCSGRLRCPHCDDELRPWGSARLRVVRLRDGDEPLTPRRGRCRGCGQTSVLLPDRFLVRRVDEAAVIGAALVAKAAGAGHRRIASELGRPAETVRGWLRRFGGRAEGIVAHFSAWSLALDARLDRLPPPGPVLARAVEAIGLATRAANILLGPRPPWSWAAAMTGGRLLANTNSPFPAPG